MTAIKLEKETKNRGALEIIVVDRNDCHQHVHLAYEIVTDVEKISDLTPLVKRIDKKQKNTI
jgi:NADH dehydrogenase FAD-containing subunit